MIIVSSKADLRQYISRYKSDRQPINFVPTMGNLHQGHLQLVQYAKQLTGKTVVSIFVNPMQFNDAKDLKNYPRTLDEDIVKLRQAKADLLFCPEIGDIYPTCADNNNRIQSTVVVPQLSQILEGASRSGHFEGVTTVVCKLFNLVQADNAVFGEKDFQQLQIIKKMVLDLDFAVNIHSYPIVREDDGLAMSSRNNRLTPQQRQKANALYLTLCGLKQAVLEGQNDYQQLQQRFIKALDLTRGSDNDNECTFKTDYLLIADSNTLLPAQPDCRQRIILAAAYLGNIRLLDNLLIDEQQLSR